MLSQMEAFSAAFIVSTNAMDNLDQAVLRWFDAKLNFGYLKADQALVLCQQYAAVLDIDFQQE